MKKAQIKELVKQGNACCQLFASSEMCNESPVVGICKEGKTWFLNMLFYTGYEYADSIEGMAGCETLELNKYDIEDLQADPVAFFNDKLENYFSKK